MTYSRPITVLVFALTCTAFGQATDWLPTIPVGTTEVKLELHSAGFNGSVLGINQILPSKLAPIPDGSGRMVVSTLGGLLRIMDADGNISASNSGVYLNTNTAETSIAPFAYGVTSVAFHPDFANRSEAGFGKFYTLVTEAPKVSPAGYDFIPVVGSVNEHAAVLVEYTVDAGAIGSDVLVTSGGGQNVTRRELFIAQEPDNEHNFCDLAFDVNGLLYISAGDGLFNYNGGVNPEAQNAQELGCVLGKVLRIDPLGNNSANGNYGIVASNVFAADADPSTLGEIYSYGHRNLWRISIDQVTGDIIVAEVGHFNIEEVNRSFNGGNFGWPAMEGSFLINPSDGFDLTPDVGDSFATANGITPPVFEYDHQDGKSVTGGFVYRGSTFPTLQGKYFFADFQGGDVATSPRLFAGDLDTGQFEQLVLASGSTNLGQPVSFGEDATGELYVVAIDGRVLSINPTNVPQVVVSDSFSVTQGIYVSGGIAELASSDDADLTIRPFGPGSAEFQVKGVSPVANPSSFEVTLECSVSPLLSNVTQTIELFDYDDEAWEEVDSRRAGRIDDDTVEVAATGDLSRYVEAGTGCIEARIRFKSNNPRRRFISNTDLFKWTISP
jgi:glucose/arabinose dehydrogenase